MRIRSVKPSFFKNDRLADLDPLARLLFIGLWCIADGCGRLEDRPKRIKAEALPYDECDVDHLLSSLASSHFIVRYQSGGKRFIEISGFKKHQRINGKEAEQESELPGPSEDATEDVAGSIGEASGKQSGICREASIAQEGKGREGKGREGEPEAVDASPPPPPITSRDIEANPASRWRYEQQTSWVRTLSRTLGSKLGDKLGAKLWPQYKRLVDLYGINLVEAVAGDLDPDDRWPERLETALRKERADLDRKHAMAPDADPVLDRCRGLIAEHGWELCLQVIAIRNVPDEDTLVVALSGNRALARKLIAHFDPDADRAQGAA